MGKVFVGRAAAVLFRSPFILVAVLVVVVKCRWVRMVMGRERRERGGMGVWIGGREGFLVLWFL